MVKTITATPAYKIVCACLLAFMTTAFSTNTNGQSCTFPAPIVSASPSTTVCAGNSVTLSAEHQVVKDLNFPYGSTVIEGQDQWQTFIPTISGNLRAIELFVNCGNSDVTFTLYNGAGIGGTVLGSPVSNVSFCNSVRIYTFNLSGVNVTAGNTYTFRIQASYPVQLSIINSTYGTYYNSSDPNTSSIRLSFVTYMYQPFSAVEWYNNATLIPGATSLTYQASTPGNYWCSAFSGTCYSAPSNVVVVANGSPTVPDVTASGITTFCARGSVALTASVAPITDVSFASMSGATGSLKRMWQSFVPVADGMTTSIKVRPAVATSDTIRLNIYNGLGVYGTLLSSQRVVMSGGGPSNNYEFIDLPITTPLHLTPGNTYTFELINPGFSLMEGDGNYGTYFEDYTYPSWRSNFQTIVSPFMNNVQWFDGASPIPGATSFTYNATTSGNYNCKNGGSGCFSTASDSINVTVNSPLADAGGDLPALCRGATTPPLGGSFGGGVTAATWSDGGAGGTFTNNSGSAPGTATYTISSSAPASITLTLTTVGGSCGTATANKIITVNPLLAPAVGTTISPSAAVCAGTQVTLTGTGADIYSWTGGVTNGVPFTPSSTTTYYLTGTNTNTGCSNFLARTVTVNPLPAGTITSSSSGPVCAGTSVTLSVTNLAGTASYNWVGGIDTPPLDNISGTAFMALGLRKLRSAYNGPCLRLERNSDNALMDFGFNGDYLDVASIVSWLGGNTGSVTILYDQSGHSTNVTHLAIAPTLVINGMNGNPVLHFNTGQSLSNTINYGLPSTFIYGSRQTGGAHQRGLSSSDGAWLLGYSNGARAQAYYGAWVSPQGTPLADDAFHIYTGAAIRTNAKVYEDGNLVADANGSFSGPSSIQLNGRNVSEYSDIDFMDVISYLTVLSDPDRISIENSIKNFYSTTRNSSLTIMPFADTVCTLTLISPQGCVSTPTVTVQISNKDIVASAGSGGNISPNGTSSICPGNNQTYTITANPGYHIAEVLIDSVSNTGAISTGSYTFTNVTAAHSIAATFNCNAPFISGTASPSATVCAGTAVTLNGTGANTYTWSAGVTNGVPFTPSATSTYTLTATDASGCSGSAEWVKISAGQFHSLGIKSDGTLWSWGDNGVGQLGDGTTTPRSTPAQVGTGTNWIAIGTGYNFSLGIKSDGTLWAWGDNSVGELGDPTHPNSYLPIQIGTATNWTSIAAGSQHSLGMKSDGTLWAWGLNSSGQLGDATNANKNTPVQVGTGTNWVGAKAGDSHSLGIKSDGTLWAWGFNNRGQLGDGTTTNKNTPAQVGTGTNWMSVSGGSSHSLGIRSDGTLWAWGDNFVGQSGNGTSVNGSNTPVQVGTGTNWMSVAAGSLHSLGIKSDGTLWAWGYNNDGELGNGTTSNRTSPVQVTTGTTWSGASGGGFYSLGIKSDGSVWGWGNNGAGQLGDGTTTPRLIPMLAINQPGFQVTVNIKPSPTVGITVSPSATVTAGTPVTLTGTGANTYSWSDGVIDGVAFNPTSTTTYTVTGTGANGCTNTATQTVTVNEAVLVTASDVSGCEGSSIALSGSPAGGTFSVPNPYTGPGTTYTYSYTDANGNSFTSAPATITVNALPTVGAIASPSATVCAGTSVTLTGTGAITYSWTGGVADGVPFVPSSDATYTITATDANGCTNTAIQTITINPLPVVTASNVSGCTGSPIALSGSPAGGTYSLPNPYTGSSTTYTYTYTNANGCSKTSAPATITVNPLPTVGSTVSPSSTVCAGTAVVLSGTGASSYSWSGGVTNSVAFIPSSATTYTVTGTDANGCTNTALKTVTVNPLPTVGITISPSAIVCAGTAVTLRGTGATTYSWSSRVTDGLPFVPSSTATYTVTATDANGCTKTATQTITVNPLPVVTASNVTGCAGSAIILSGSPAGGTYSLPNPYTGPSTTYTYTYTDANGCSKTSAPANITVNPLPTVGSTVSPSSTVCAGTAVILSGTGASSYSWSGGVTNSVAFIPSSATTYTVTGTDANGCTNTALKTVTVNPLPTVGIAISPSAIVCAGTAVTLSGTGAVSYSWSGGITNGVAFTPSTTTIYTVTGTAANGCTNTATITITVMPVPAAAGAISGPSKICTSQSGIVYSVAPIRGAASYVWTVPSTMNITAGNNTASITVSTSSSFNSGTITAKGKNNCGLTGASSSITVVKSTTAPATPGAISGISTLCGPGSSIFSIDAVTNATSYAWTVSGSGLSISSGQGTTSITVSATSAFGGGTISLRAVNCIGSSANATLKTVYGRLVSAPVFNGGAGNNLTTGVCGGSNHQYTINQVAGATSYTWSAPVGCSITDGLGHTGNPLTFPGVNNLGQWGVKVTFPSGFVSGNITVYATNTCGNSPIATLVVQSTPNIPGAITGAVSVCKSENKGNYSITAVPGAVNYTWAITGGATFVGSTTGPSVTVKFTTATSSTAALSVKANNACGSSAVLIKNITIVTNCNSLSVTDGMASDAAINDGIWLKAEVSPNPSETDFTLTLHGNSNKPVEVRVIDMYGKSIHYARGSANQSYNFGQRFTSGVYIVEILQGRLVKNLKIIKAK